MHHKVKFIQCKSMSKEILIRPLTEQEMIEITGGVFFSNIIAWFKKHILRRKEDEHSWESGCNGAYTGTNYYGVGFDI